MKTFLFYSMFILYFTLKIIYVHISSSLKGHTYIHNILCHLLLTGPVDITLTKHPPMYTDNILEPSRDVAAYRHKQFYQPKRKKNCSLKKFYSLKAKFYSLKKIFTA